MGGGEETHPLGHLAAVRVVVVVLQHDDGDDHGQAHDDHGAGEVLGCGESGRGVRCGPVVQKSQGGGGRRPPVRLHSASQGAEGVATTRKHVDLQCNRNRLDGESVGTSWRLQGKGVLGV